jgi:electron transport complex protein RnfG
MTKVRDVLILTAITLISGFLLGGVYELTKDPIAQQQIEANAEAYRAVCPGAESFKNDDTLDDKVEDSGSLLEGSELDLGNVTVDDALYAYDSSDNLVGMIIKTTSKDGYGGNISLAVGIREENGSILVSGIDYLEINETAGLGMKATEEDFKNQFKDKSVESFEVTKSGAVEENQIDALSGATFTSNAVTNAVNTAIYFARESALK